MFIPKYVVQKWLYPLHERAKGQRTVERYSEMLNRDSWSLEALEKFQLDALRRLILVAYENAPFYRDHFDKHLVEPGKIVTLADFESVPCIDKDDIRANRERMVTLSAVARQGLVKASTGGSTGDPLRFYVDRGCTANGWAACWRARSWWGLNWGDPWFWIWGSPIELSVGETFTHRTKEIRDVMVNRRVLSAFDMTDDVMAKYVNRIRSERPRYLYAYASAAYLLADYVLRHSIDLSANAPHVVFTTSDMLYPHMRTAIEQAFHCPVSNEYGSREASFIAHECPRGRMHIHSDRVYVEIVDGGKRLPAGESGEIVVTPLDATGMPFIRYRSGDIGSLDADPCPCGLPEPVLRSVEGRCDDLLVARGNRMMHSMAVIYYIKEIESIRQFRIYQDSVERLRIDIVRAAPDSIVPNERIIDTLRKQFGYPLEVEICLVDRLAPTASGKHRSVVSTLTHHHFSRGTEVNVHSVKQ